MLVHIRSQVHLPSLGKDSLDGSRRMWEINSLGNGHMRTVEAWFGIEGTCIPLVLSRDNLYHAP